jgi:hypothetical protein
MSGWTDWLHNALNPRDCDCPLDRDCTCEPEDFAKTYTDDGTPSYHCDDPACGCEKPGRWWTQEARKGRRENRRETWQDIKRAWSGTPPTDEQVEHLDKAVERAFAERDRLVEVWRRTGRDEDEAAADALDRHADRLLTQYNAACEAQTAEVHRRRAENLARYEQEQIDRDMGKDGGGTFVDMPPPAEPYQPPGKDTAMPDTAEATWKSRVDWKGLSDFNRRRGHELIERARHYWAQEIADGQRPDIFHVRRLLREAALSLGISEVHLQEAINNPPGQVIDEPNPTQSQSSGTPMPSNASEPDPEPRYGDPAWEEARRQAENADRYRRSAADADEQAERAEHMADPTNEIGQDARDWNRRRAETHRVDAEELRGKAAEAERKAAGDVPDPLVEAERIVRRADEVDAYHNGSTPAGRTIYGPDGTTPIRTYRTVDNGDGTTVMHIMTLYGWRELPETRANNGRRDEPKQARTTPTTTSTSGGAMASIEEVKAGIGQANDTASNSLGGLQQAHSDIEQASGMLQQAAQGSSQADADEATGLFQRAIELITEVQQTVSMAIQSAEAVAARL